MKTMTIKVLVGWRAVLAWIAIFAVCVAYWEVGKAVFYYVRDLRRFKRA
jgi:hypothetical protein